MGVGEREKKIRQQKDEKTLQENLKQGEKGDKGKEMPFLYGQGPQLVPAWLQCGCGMLPSEGDGTAFLVPSSRQCCWGTASPSQGSHHPPGPFSGILGAVSRGSPQALTLLFCHLS